MAGINCTLAIVCSLNTVFAFLGLQGVGLSSSTTDKYGTRLFHGIGVKYQQMFIICSNATQMVYKELLYYKEGQSM